MTSYKAQSLQPYSLHDARINKLQLEGENLVLTFEQEHFWMELPSGKEVLGKRVTVQGLDIDFCSGYLLSQNGREGVFQAEKMPLDKLCGMISDACPFEIVDELYSWNQIFYSGYFYSGEKCREMQVFLYHTGSILYELSN